MLPDPREAGQLDCGEQGLRPLKRSRCDEPSQARGAVLTLPSFGEGGGDGRVLDDKRSVVAEDRAVLTALSRPR